MSECYELCQDGWHTYIGGCQHGERPHYADVIAEAVLKGPGNVVTVPAAGTWLVIDGAVHRARPYREDTYVKDED